MKRDVHCRDAVGWLQEQPTLKGCSFVTSLPDVSEVPLKFDAWTAWFVDTAALILSKVPPDGVALFFQTDIKRSGVWVDKGYLVQKGAERQGAGLLWHKVVCRAPPGKVTFGRPAWAHLLCFAPTLRLEPGQSTADVLPETGHMTWARAMGLNACEVACRFIRERTSTRTVVDPFCGVGTALAVANRMGLDAIGVELNRKRAEKARALVLPP